MSKDIAMREREREMEYIQKVQVLEEKEEKLQKQKSDVEKQKKIDMVEINNKIRATHELVKTVMSLHHEDFTSFEQNSNHKISGPKNFSFDANKVVKEIANDQLSQNESESM